MIPTGMNGRTEGTFLVHELLAAKKISIPKDDLLYTDGHHKLLGVEFSDEIREDPALSAVLQEITEDLIRLFYEAEKDERLFVPKERIGGTLRQYVRNEDLTGMTLLNLFADRFITLCERDDGTWEWKAIPLVMRELPDAQKIIGAVLEDILGFSGRVGTSAAFSGVSSMSPLTERETSVKKNVEGTLTILHDMMEELDEETETVREEDVLSHVTFTEERSADIDGVRVPVPDGFSINENTDGHRAILYRPNLENPEVYESSGLIYYLDRDENGVLSVRAAVRVDESRREETERQLVARLQGHIFL